MSDIKVYEIGDTALFQGNPYLVADVQFNNRRNCPCRDWCARLELHGVGYLRACQLDPAPAATEPELTADETAAVDEISAIVTERPAIDRTVTAGNYKVHVFTTAAGQTTRLEVLHRDGGLVKVDTRDGLADMTFTYTDHDLVCEAANDVVDLLRAGYTPSDTALLVLAFKTI